MKTIQSEKNFFRNLYRKIRLLVPGLGLFSNAHKSIDRSTNSRSFSQELNQVLF